MVPVSTLGTRGAPTRESALIYPRLDSLPYPIGVYRWWARLHFGDGGTLDIPEPIADLQRPDFEKVWRAEHVRVEWFTTPKGRLDHVLRKQTDVRD